MTASFPSLLRFYVLSTYGLRGRALKGRASGEQAPDARTRAKAAAKAAGVAALVILVLGDIGILFFGLNFETYRALKGVGLQGLLLLNASITTTFLVLTLGFATALSTYCLSGAETVLLSMPVKPRHLLGAKIATVYLSEFLLAFLMMATAFGVYAWGEGPDSSFYLYALLSTIALPLLPLAASYLLLVPLMSAARFLRNKNAVMVLAGIVGLVFALVFNFLVQSAASRLQDPAWLLANYAGPDALVARIGRAYLPAYLSWKATTSGWTAGLGAALGNLALGAAAILALVAALGPAYASSLARFGETRIRKLASASGFIGKTMRRRGLGTGLFLREWRLMNREPVYLLNGPLIVLLMPVIMAIALVTQRDQLAPLLQGLEQLGDGPWAMLVAAAFGAFLASSTSITCTAVSRDAKVLSWIKSLPIPMRRYALAKFLHGLFFAGFGALVGGLGLGLVLGLGALEALGALFIALSVGSLVNIAGLWLDTLNPRIAWDSPTAALKQNPNAVIVILGAMGLIGGLGALAATLRLSTLGFTLLYGLVPALLAALALWLYPAYAERRLARLETQ